MAERYASLKQGLVGCWIPSVSGSGFLLPDLSGRGNNGTLTNMASDDWVSSQYGRALDFDGSNDFVNAGAGIPNQTTSDIAVSCWFLPRNITSFQGLVTRWNAGPANAAFQLLIRNTGVLACQIVDSANVNQDAVFGVTSLSLSTWQHACAVKRRNALEIYLNGRLDATATATTIGIGATTADVFLGARNLNGSSDLFLNGQLDDIRLYSRALSDSEIRLLSSEPGIGFKPNPAKKLSRFSQRYATYQPPKAKTYSVVRVKETDHANLREGLVGAWCPSIAGSGNLLPDLSGRGNNGVLTNMAADDWVSAQYGRALDFDGINDYVNCGRITAIESQTNVSFSFWSKWELNSGNLASFFSYARSGVATDDIFFFYSLGNYRIQINDGTDGGLNFAASVPSGWTHYAICFRGAANAIDVYINAIKQVLSGAFTPPSTTATGTSSHEFWLAGYAAFPAGWELKGQIDDMRAYNRELIPSEIRILAQRPGIGLRQEQHRQTFYQFPSGVRRRLLLTGQT